MIQILNSNILILLVFKALTRGWAAGSSSSSRIVISIKSNIYETRDLSSPSYNRVLPSASSAVDSAEGSSQSLALL